MHKSLRILMVSLAVAFAAPASADDLVADMGSVTQFCFKYFETGQASDALLKRGFKPKGKSFRKRYASSNFLNKRGYHVTPRKKGTECYVTIRGNSKEETRQLGAGLSKAAAAMGYRKSTFTNRFGTEKPVLEKSGVVVSYIARNVSQSGSYSTEIIFQREK